MNIIMPMINPYIMQTLVFSQSAQCRRKVRAVYNEQPVVLNKLVEACEQLRVRSLSSLKDDEVVYYDQDVKEHFVLNLSNFEHADVGVSFTKQDKDVTQCFNAGEHSTKQRYALLKNAVGVLRR